MPAVFRLIGALRGYTNNISEIPAPIGLTIRQALIELRIPPEIVAMALVNDQPQSKDYIIQENDRIQLLAVIGGG